MAKVIKIFKTLRNHWKKSTFACIVGFYGYEFAVERRRQFMMMRQLCEEAGKYGSLPLPMGAHNKHVTLFLNPAAAGRKGKTKFEKFGEPLLHMAGFLVTIVKTERVNEAKDLTGVIDKTNVIAVAGGGGTLSEVITGLLRREDAPDACRMYPIGIIPVGNDNLYAASMPLKSKEEPDRIAEATMAIVTHRVKPQNVIKIQVTNPEKVVNEETGEETEVTLKPVYSMSGLRLGMVREALKRKADMPSLLGEYFTTFWSFLRTSPVNFKAEIRYTPPCEGCLRCYKEEHSDSNSSLLSKLTSVFRPRKAQIIKPTTENENCGVWTLVEVDTPEFNIKPDTDGALTMEIGKTYSGKTEFLMNGFKMISNEDDTVATRIKFSAAEITPRENPEFCSIDGDEFEVKAISIELLKNQLLFFTPAS